MWLAAHLTSNRDLPGGHQSKCDLVIWVMGTVASLKSTGNPVKCRFPTNKEYFYRVGSPHAIFGKYDEFIYLSFI